MAAEWTLGVIGVGQMGGALVRGIVRAGTLAADRIAVYDTDVHRIRALAAEVSVQPATDGAALAAGSAIVILAVKPGVVCEVAREIAGAVGAEQTVVSIAAGVPLARLRQALGDRPASLIRVMPNTPALVGAGAFAVAAPGVAEEKVRAVGRLLEPLGRVVIVPEEMLDAATGLSGSGPAFVFVVIEALADGGVAAGLPRAVALELAAQTVLGAAKMVLDTGQHPGALKDAVASPGGTTIAGLAELERAGVRAGVLAAVTRAAARARELAEG